MKSMKSILFSTLVVLFASSCSKDDDGTFDLSNINATYVQTVGPTHKEFSKKYVGLIIEEWDQEVYNYFSYSEVPQDYYKKIGSHIERTKAYEWIGYQQYEYWIENEVDDYIFFNHSIELDETVKAFLIFENKGTCYDRVERYINHTFLKTTYVDYSFKGNSELEQKYAEQLKLIGTIQTKDLDESFLNKTIYSATYAVNNYHGTSDSNAAFFMSGDIYFIDIYLGANNTINPIQKLPKVSDWGEYELTATESPSYFPDL